MIKKPARKKKKVETQLSWPVWCLECERLVMDVASRHHCIRSHHPLIRGEEATQIATRRKAA